MHHDALYRDELCLVAETWTVRRDSGDEFGAGAREL
jgi:hypothetical protein